MYIRRLMNAFSLALILACAVEPSLAEINVTTLQQIPLSFEGGAREINQDVQGALWVTEYSANSIWHVDPAANTRTRYSGLSGGLAEAQRGPDDTVWFNGYDNATIGRLSLDAATVTTWTIPGATQPLGLAIDVNEDVWIADYDVARLYRFTPASTHLCTFTLPNESKTIYLHPKGEDIWLTDYTNDALLRLDTATGSITSWFIQPPDYANPYALTTDAHGNVWWTESGSGNLARLEPGANRITRYGEVSSPNFLQVDGENVWFLDVYRQTFGVMNAARALGTSHVVTPTTTALTQANCVNLGAGTNAPVLVEESPLTLFNTAAPDAVKAACGWMVQSVPAESQLYDIAVANGRIYLTDFGQDRLITTPDIYSDRAAAPCYDVYLPTLLHEK